MDLVAWYRATVDARGGRAVYCSTLAAHIFNTAEQRLERVIAAHEKTIVSAHLCRHSRELVTAALDDTLVRWNLDTGKKAGEVALPGTPLVVAPSPYARLVAVALEDGRVYLVSLLDGESRRVKSMPEGVSALSWSPDGDPDQPPVLVVGCRDGSVAVWRQDTGKVVGTIPPLPQAPSEGGHRSVAVTHIEWEPLGKACFLFATADGRLALVDAASASVAMEFARLARPATMMAFSRIAPGDFFTISVSEPSPLRWNVSQPTNRGPMSRVRPRSSLAQLQPPAGPAAVAQLGMLALKAVPGGSAGPQSGRQQVFLAAWRDGSVGLWDAGCGSMVMLSAGGHCETIFDCRFRNGLDAESAHTLATASFDGTTKIWDARSMKCTQSLGGQPGILYALAWAPPGDAQGRVMAASSTGDVWVWSTREARCVQRARFCESHKIALRLAWNPVDPELAAVSYLDGLCVVFSPSTGAVRSRLEHGLQVTGVDWNPHEPHLLATGCADGHVRIWDVRHPGSKAGGEPKTVLRGHTQRAFNTVWSPLDPALLASGSDDRSVRVWNAREGREVRVLLGHTAQVRALAWSPELRLVLASGSWDGTVRLWDVGSGSCLAVAADHLADVYGLTVHPLRPFTYVTSSRDATLRVWSVERLVRRAFLRALVSGGRLAPADAQASGMEGPGMQRLVSLTTAPATPAARALEALCLGFVGLPGVGDLWALSGSLASGQSTDSAAEVHAVADLARLARSEASQLRVVRGLGRGRASEQLRRAAEIYSQVGDLREYCEVLIELQDWDGALAVAPGVSLEYWRELGVRRAREMARDGSGDADHSAGAYALLQACNALDELEETMAEDGDFAGAMLVQVAAAARSRDAYGGRSGGGPGHGYAASSKGTPSDGGSALAQLKFGRQQSAPQRRASSPAGSDLQTVPDREFPGAGRPVLPALPALRASPGNNNPEVDGRSGGGRWRPTGEEPPSAEGSQQAVAGDWPPPEPAQAVDPAALSTPAVRRAASRLVDAYVAARRPVVAACVALSVGDLHWALWLLDQGELHALAFALAAAHEHRPPRESVRWVARQLARARLWKEAARVALTFGDADADALLLVQTALAADEELVPAFPSTRNSGPASVDEVLGEAGLPDRATYLARARQLEADGCAASDGPRLEACVRWFVVGGDPESALRLGLASLHRQMSSGEWCTRDASEILRPLQHVSAHLVPEHQRMPLKAFSACVGAYLAAERGYASVVDRLADEAVELCRVSEMPHVMPAWRAALLKAEFWLRRGQTARAATFSRAVLEPAAAAAGGASDDVPADARSAAQNIHAMSGPDSSVREAPSRSPRAHEHGFSARDVGADQDKRARVSDTGQRPSSVVAAEAWSVLSADVLWNRVNPVAAPTPNLLVNTPTSAQRSRASKS